MRDEQGFAVSVTIRENPTVLTLTGDPSPA
jgi:hypothetical protein